MHGIVFLFTSHIFLGVNAITGNVNNHSDNATCDEHCATFSTFLDTYVSQYDTLTALKNKYRHIYACKDPMLWYEHRMNSVLFGDKIDKSQIRNEVNIDKERLVYYPSGDIMRADLFLNRTGVHLPLKDYIQPGYCRLKITKDYMQTAVNAFAIFIYGSIEDIYYMPSDYVLRSARAISMMKITREKYVATWAVVKGDRPTEEIPYKVLELYRPLFKYLSGREIARLNLSDNKILTYIGTHAELNRHQVGVVASRYLKLNPNWSDPMYLNMMNNLICGVPMTYMRRLSENTFLQLSDQIFYHIRACDPLQRRFLLATMTKTQTLGKSFSWTARDVSRLGLLLAEVEGPQLAAICPEAMTGITAQVMMAIPARNLRYITEVQLRHLAQKPLNILARKIEQEDEMQDFSKTIKRIL